VKIFQVIPLLTWKAAVKYYRLEVEYMDRLVGKFLGKLEREKLLDKTIVVITGDHGEGLGERERYFGHVRYLNRQFIEVPLIMFLPGIKTKRITTPVSLIGISPTLLEFMGIQDHSFNYQHSLIPVITSQNGRSAARRTVYSFAFSPSAVEDKFCVIQWPYQSIFNRDYAGRIRSETYDLVFSQSFRKLDEFSPDVLMRRSRKDYLALRRASRRINGLFGKQTIAKLKIKSHKGEIEKLKTMGYIH
jgi:arylsulfatase A-like enzyme